MTEEISKNKYSVRCFRRKGKGSKGRHGIWIMTEPDGPNKFRGIFVSGDVNETDPPNYSVDELATGSLFDGSIRTEEITPKEAVEELENWYVGRLEIMRILERHTITEEA